MPAVFHREHHHAQAPAHYLTPLQIDPYYMPHADGDDGCEFQPDLIERPDPNRPTFLIPGSPEKIELLAARYAAGVKLWHDDDLAAFPGRVYSINAE